MEVINEKYLSLCKKESDINEHLPTLYFFAKNCESILESGVRGCVSSWALVKGLLENGKQKKSIVLNDIQECDTQDLQNAVKELSIEVKTVWINNLKLELTENVDLTFIDTWHVYGHLKRELEKFSRVTNKYIILHDTTVDAVKGESLRMGHDILKMCLDSGYSADEITCGLQKAIDEFLDTHKDWQVLVKYFHNNGLTVLQKIG